MAYIELYEGVHTIGLAISSVSLSVSVSGSMKKPLLKLWYFWCTMYMKTLGFYAKLLLAECAALGNPDLIFLGLIKQWQLIFGVNWAV